MYSQEKIYRSLLYFVEQIVPSGVEVTDGESYGIRLDDPTGKSPAVTVTMPESRDQALELGSFGTAYSVIFTISAVSRMQRDALKSIVHSGILLNQIPVYSNLNQQFVPASGAFIEKYASVGDYFQIRDMPNFSSDREKFFWGAAVFVTLDVLGL